MPIHNAKADGDGEYKTSIRGKTHGSYTNVNKGLLSTKCKFIENTHIKV